MQANYALKRWQDLRCADGWKKVTKTIFLLRVLALVLCLGLVYSVVYLDSKIAPAIIGLILGWAVSEKNALITRKQIWPTLEKVIDWELVEKELGETPSESNL